MKNSFYRLEKGETSLKIIIPSRKKRAQNPLLILILLSLSPICGIMICGLIPFIIIGPLVLIFDPETFVEMWPLWLYLLFFLLIGSIFGIPIYLVFYSALWRISGQEVIDLNAQTLMIHRQMGGFGRPRRYPVEMIYSLQVVPLREAGVKVFVQEVASNMFRKTTNTHFYGPSFLMAVFGNIMGGSIVGTYANRKIRSFRFGIELEEAEARQLLNEMRPYLPQTVIFSEVA